MRGLLSNSRSNRLRVTPLAVRLCLVSLLFTAGLAVAQDGQVAKVEASQVTAPVVVDGVELFRLRGAPSYPAEERARAVAGRIVAVARDRSVEAKSIRIEPSELGPRLTYGDGSETIVVVVEADAEVESLKQKELATILRALVIEAVTSYRELRTPERLLHSAGWAIVATALLVAFWFAGRWLFRRIEGVVNRRIEGAVERLRIQSFRLLSVEQTWKLLRGLLRGLRAIAMLTVLYAYLNFVLGLWPWTHGFAVGMLDLIIDPLLTIGQAALASIPDIFFLVVLTFVTRLVLRLIHLFFVEIKNGVVRFENFDPDWAMPTYRLVRVLVIAFALVVAFPYIPGSSSGAFKGVSLFVGVLFSLGSSSVIGNMIAGYTMTYRRAFRDGDRIRVGDVFGEVTSTRLMVTNVRTPKNENVVIPNSLILSNNVINYSTHATSNGLILHTTVGIGYEVPWRQVEAMLLEAAGRTDGLSRDPSPFVLQTALGDFAVTYELNAYVKDTLEIPQHYSRLHRNILDVFNEYGVAIMTPSYVADPTEPKLVPPESWYAVPARRPDGSD